MTTLGNTLESFWYVACGSNELGSKPVSRVLFGRPLVIFRDDSGKPCALEDRCAHRNFPLSVGRVVAGEIQCSYHGWCYDAQGKVSRIPSLPERKASCDRALAIQHFACLERDGYVWVVPSGGAGVEQPPVFPNLGQPGFQTFRLKTRFDGDVETCLENFLDCPHAAFVHAGLFRTHHNRAVEAVVRARDDGAEVEYFNESREAGLVWRLLSRKRSELRHTDRFIRPATSQVDYEFSDGRAYSITSVCTPVAERVTDVYTVISFKFGFLGGLIRPIFQLLALRIINQDVEAVRLQRDNIRRFGEKTQFRIVESDFLLPHILQWRGALRKGHGKPVVSRREEERVAINI